MILRLAGPETLAARIALPTAHGGLLRLITRWMAGPMKIAGVAFAWRRIGGPPVNAPLFQVGFHLAVGMAMAVFYAFAVEPLLRGPALVKGLTYAAAVWLLMQPWSCPSPAKALLAARTYHLRGWLGSPQPTPSSSWSWRLSTARYAPVVRASSAS